MISWAEAVTRGLEDGFEVAADPLRSAGMSKYMRDQFPFFGIASNPRKAIISQAMSRADGWPSEADLQEFARSCFEQPEREFHYAAVTVLRLHVKTLTAASIPTIHHMVTTLPWWDTVDAIASHLAGSLVLDDPEVVEIMDEWAASAHLWVARTAILHQLRYKALTDAERLFRYCAARADESDFFYRKAIGWALRQYGKTNPDAVREFCSAHESHLSPLSLREALKLL